MSGHYWYFAHIYLPEELRLQREKIIHAGSLQEVYFFFNTIPTERSAAQVTADRKRVRVLPLALPWTTQLIPTDTSCSWYILTLTLTRHAPKVFIPTLVSMMPNIFKKCYLIRIGRFFSFNLDSSWIKESACQWRIFGNIKDLHGAIACPNIC